MSTPAALITGASAGLGREFARLFAADGHDVVLVARRQEKLTELAQELQSANQIRAEVVAVDLSRPEAPAEIAAAVQALGLEISFLVNNAGFGDTGAFAEADASRQLEMIAVNITALTALTHHFVGPMIARGTGRVLNIGSTAGFQAGPFMATYYASKAYVNHFSEALDAELAGTGVTVTVSCPGATATEFAGIAGNDKTLLFASGVATSESVAQHAYKAMHRGQRLAIPGLKNKLLVQSLRLSPRRLIHAITGKLNTPR